MAKKRPNNNFITIAGERKILAEWCEIYGISKQCVIGRIKSGMDPEEAITKPTRKYRDNQQRRVEREAAEEYGGDWC